MDDCSRLRSSVFDCGKMLLIAVAFGRLRSIAFVTIWIKCGKMRSDVVGCGKMRNAVDCG